MRGILANKSNRRLISVLLGGLLLVVLAFVSFRGDTETVNLKAYDWLMRSRSEIAPDPRIVLVTLDEESRTILQKKISQFTRSYFASAIENMVNDGAYVVFMDFDFSKRTYQDPTQDETLRRVLEETGSYVVLAKFVSGDGISVFPLPEYQELVLDLAMINLHQDPDGVVRKAPAVEILLHKDDSMEAYMNMGLNVAWWVRAPDETGIPVEEIERPFPEFQKDEDGSASAVILDPLVVPIFGVQGFIRIDYVGPSGTYPRIPFGNVVRGNFEPGTFDGKIILVGNTHPTGHDFYSTPMATGMRAQKKTESLEIAEVSSSVMPGVEVHANLLDTVLHERYRSSASKNQVLGYTVAFGLLAILLFWLLEISTVWTFIIYLGMISGIGVVSWFFFMGRRMYLPFFDPMLVLTVQFVGGTMFHRIVQGLEKAQITQTFGRYVSPQVVQNILDDPNVAKLGGEKREMTVLFSDIRGFTTISEAMDPSDLVNFLNRYLTRSTKVIFDAEGVVDKYMGDAVMAFWGAPISLPNHAALSCKAALEMMEDLVEFRDLKENQGLPAIDIGIGMNTGIMTVGNMGSDMRFDYTVMGDAVNLGSRLEGINKQYKTNIIISEFTAAQVKDEFVLRELDQVRVKGKNEPVRIFELLGFGQERASWSRVTDGFATALSLYRAQKWDEAKAALEAVLHIRPEDGPSQVYLERIDMLRDTDLPADWDGVFVMKTK